MRDFLRELFALPKYKLWNIFLLFLLVIISNLFYNCFTDYVFSKKISNDFYSIHAYIYSGITVLCMIILMCNRFRGRKCWYFLGILFFDFSLLTYCWEDISSPEHLSAGICTLAIWSVFFFIYPIIIDGLIDLRRIRLNLKPSRWDIVMRIIYFYHLYHIFGIMTTQIARF
jgi:hypothetical protein